jgi:penicillin G amidase
VLLAAAAAAGWWWAWRPLPETSGTLEAPVGSRASIVRDRLGVPHIEAASIEDALFLQGYAAAQDRLWQMDVLRRLSGGTLAEIFGASLVESDREARRLRTARLAEQYASAMSPAVRTGFAAYARGVNFFIERSRNRLPLEFTLLGYQPRPWRIADSLLIGLYLYRGLTFTFPMDLQKAALLTGGDPAKVNFLFPVRGDVELQPGSNAWVVAGRRTATGKPILANDPHLEYSMPGIWHMAHLRAPGLDVSGVAPPGLPSILIGHNDHIGWGMTNVQFDVQDLYIEKIDLATGRYLFRGQTEQARRESEFIAVKGAPPVQFGQWVTRHGPVFVEQGRALALRWMAAEPEGFSFPFLDIDRAHNWQEFTAALARYSGPAQNFVYADTDGNIGYHAAGKLPVRRTYDGDVPVDGSSGDFEWDGLIPFKELPQTYNPPEGIIVTANQNPFPAGYPYRVNGNFVAPYRWRQIRDVLAKRSGWRTADMPAIQKDVYSPFCAFLARQAVAACGRRGAACAGVGDAVAALGGWNGQMESGAAPLLATLFYQHVREMVADRASPGKGLEYSRPLASGAESIQMAPAAIETLLRERPAGWFDDWDIAITRAFSDAVEEGRRIQGRNIAKWDWDTYNQLTLVHPVGSRLPLISSWFDIGPVPQSGSGTTVKQTTRRMGPSMRMALDFANLDDSLMNVVAGESGHVLSSHYKDQWETYYSGHSLPMPFRKVDARDTLTVTPAR